MRNRDSEKRMAFAARAAGIGFLRPLERMGSVDADECVQLATMALDALQAGARQLDRRNLFGGERGTELAKRGVKQSYSITLGTR